MPYSTGMKDSASYRNRGGWFQRLVSVYKAWRYLSRAGSNIVIKRTCEFNLTEGAVLEIGNNCTLQDFSFFQLTIPCPKVLVGNGTVIGRRNIITAKNLISIGNDVLIGSDVQIIDHGHGITRNAVIREQQAKIGEVVIGDDVWIGAGAKILMNVHIGTGAVIGANAVVVSDIPGYTIAVGIPARVIKFRE